MSKTLTKIKSKSLETLINPSPQPSVYSSISFYKRRIHLISGERRSNYERNEEKLKNNEQLIQTLTQLSQQLKTELNKTSKNTANYSKIIASQIYSGNEKKTNEFRGKNYFETVEILENKIGDLKNKINLNEWKKNGINEEIKNIVKSEENLKNVLEKNNKVFNPRYDELISTDNQTSLMQMRIIEAENIQSKYKIMISTLKNENYQKNNQIQLLENTKLNQFKERKELEEALKNALIAKKDAKEKLVEVESSTLDSYTLREDKLYEARLNLKSIRNNMETIGTKLTYPKFHLMMNLAHRDSSLTDIGNSPFQFNNSGGATQNSEFEQVYNQLKNLTGESDPNEISSRFLQLRAHSLELIGDEAGLLSEIRKIKLRKRYLQDKLNQLKFSGGVQGEDFDKEIGNVDEDIRKLIITKNEFEKELESFNSVMGQLNKKLTEIIFNNKIEITLENHDEEESDFGQIGHKIITILNGLMKQTEEAIYEQDNVFRSPISPQPTFDNEYYSDTDVDVSGATASPVSAPLKFKFPSMTGLNEKQPQQLDALSLPDRTSSNRLTPTLPYPKSTNISQGSSTSRLNLMGNVVNPKSSSPIPTGKKSDSSEEEEAASRNVIKRQSQVLIEAKIRKGGGRFNPTSNSGTANSLTTRSIKKRH